MRAEEKAVKIAEKIAGEMAEKIAGKMAEKMAEKIAEEMAKKMAEEREAIVKRLLTNTEFSPEKIASLTGVPLASVEKIRTGC